jgi:hypothetical protein
VSLELLLRHHSHRHAAQTRCRALSVGIYYNNLNPSIVDLCHFLGNIQVGVPDAVFKIAE